MKLSLSTAALALFAGLSVSSAAHAGSPIDTIADRLAAQDLFTATENGAGLDVFQPGSANWQDFDILFAAVVADGSLVSAVTDSAAALTVFAPNDLAFRELVFDLTGQVFLTEQGVLNAIVGLVMDGQVDLRKVLEYHVLTARVDLANVPLITRVVTLNGQPILFQPRLGGQAIEVKDTTLPIRNAFLLDTDLSAGNSIVHSISRVLVPTNA